MPVLMLAFVTSLGTFTGIAGARHFDRLAVPMWLATAIACLAGACAIWLIPGAQSQGWAAWTLILFVLLASIATIDAKTQMIPDALSWMLVGLGLVHGFQTGAQTVPNALLAGALILFAMTRDHITEDRGLIGSGDLFLLAGVIAWFGPLLLLDVLLVASLVIAIQLAITHNRTFPFAPAIAVGHGAVWLGGPLF